MYCLSVIFYIFSLKESLNHLKNHQIIKSSIILRWHWSWGNIKKEVQLNFCWSDPRGCWMTLCWLKRSRGIQTNSSSDHWIGNKMYVKIFFTWILLAIYWLDNLKHLKVWKTHLKKFGFLMLNFRIWNQINFLICFLLANV